MSRFNHACILTLALASMAFAPKAFAQQPTAGPQTLSLNFEGGTALDYIAALRKATPTANIVVLGDMQRINFSPVQLTNVDVWSALRLLEQLPQSQGDLGVKVQVENVATSQDVPAVFAVTAEVRGRGPGANPMQSSVISLAELLGENLKPEDALTAIQTTLEIVGGDTEPARIKFHEETGLLICQGTSDQIDSIRQVVVQLRERENAIQGRSGANREFRQAKEQAAELQMAREEMRRVNDDLARQVTEQRTRSELLEKEMTELRQAITRLNELLRQTEAERDQLMRRAADSTDSKQPKP